jgi:hypothetical protein
VAVHKRNHSRIATFKRFVLTLEDDLLLQHIRNYIYQFRSWDVDSVVFVAGLVLHGLVASQSVYIYDYPIDC